MIATIVFELFIPAFNHILPQLAETAGEGAAHTATAFVHGFFESNALGKLALGAWLVKSFGGWQAFRVLGTSAGRQTGTATAVSIASSTAEGIERGGFRTRVGGALRNTMGAIAPGAGAASKPSPKFCAAVQKIGSSKSDASDITKMAAAANGFKNAGKYAPNNVKKAANNIAQVLGQVKNITKNPTDLAKFYTTAGFKSYGKSILTFYTYAENCAA